MKRLQAKPRRKRKSIILTMKYVLDIHEDDNKEVEKIGQAYKSWMRDKFSEWDETILQYFLYDTHVQQNETDDRLHLESFMDKIIKDDTDAENMVAREIEELNLNNDNKDTSSSESTTEREFKEN